MLINTSRFGEIEYQEEHVFTMVEGILGFPKSKKYIILNHQNNTIFKWLQSIDDPELAFVIVEPYLFFPDYSFDLNDDDVDILKIRSRDKVMVYTILVIPEDPKLITANLKAPVVINSDNRKGKQVALLDERYTTRHYIFAQDNKE